MTPFWTNNSATVVLLYMQHSLCNLTLAAFVVEKRSGGELRGYGGPMDYTVHGSTAHSIPNALFAGVIS